MKTVKGWVYMKKPKIVFVLLALFVTLLLLVFSFALAEGSILLMLLAVLLIIATMGYGFTLKKKYRENNWL